MGPLAHSVNSLSKLLRVSPKRVRAWIRSGELRAVNVADNGTRASWRILAEDLEAFLSERTVASNGQKRSGQRDVTKFF